MSNTVEVHLSDGTVAVWTIESDDTADAVADMLVSLLGVHGQVLT